MQSPPPDDYTFLPLYITYVIAPLNSLKLHTLIISFRDLDEMKAVRNDGFTRLNKILSEPLFRNVRTVKFQIDQLLSHHKEEGALQSILRDMTNAVVRGICITLHSERDWRTK